MCYSRAKTDKNMVVDPNCRNKNYRDRDLEAIIFAEIRKLKSEPLYIAQLRDSVDYATLIEAAEKRLLAIEKQISKMMDLYTIGTIDLTMVKDKTQALADEKRKLEEEIDTHKGMQMAQLDQNEVTDFVDLFEKAVQSGDTAEINNVIAELIEFIEIENENIKIHWNF
jgi:site-specific DNA recombinase